MMRVERHDPLQKLSCLHPLPRLEELLSFLSERIELPLLFGDRVLRALDGLSSVWIAAVEEQDPRPDVGCLLMASLPIEGFAVIHQLADLHLPLGRGMRRGRRSLGS